MKTKFTKQPVSSIAIATALATACATIATPSSANSVSINGGPATITTGSIFVVAPGSDVDVLIDSSDIDPGFIYVDYDTGERQTITVTAGRTVNNPAGYGIYGVSKTSAITVTIEGTVRASGNAVTLDSRFAPDGGSVTLNGSGRIASPGLAGVWLLNDIGVTTLDGITGGMSGVNFGALINPNGTYASAAGGDVNIGMNTRLGDVTSDGVGILATATSDTISTQSVGAVGGVSGGGRDGIHANAGSGDIAIGTLGAVGPVTGADAGMELRTAGAGTIALTTTVDVTGLGEWGVYSFAQNGATMIEITNGSNITGNARGLEAFASGSDDISVNIGAGSIIVGREFGMLTGTGTGTATVNNAGLITSSDAASDKGGDAYWAFAGATSPMVSGTPATG